MNDRVTPVLDPAVLAYYKWRSEQSRLERGVSQIEGVRTRHLIERHAPPPPVTALDVGGAAGAYASWLAAAGYAVHLVDPVPRLVEEARRRNGTLTRPVASIELGDARALERPSASVDVVLMLGPLYPLTTPHDRAQALAEGARVLRAGGILFAAAISRWASALDGLVRDMLGDPQFARRWSVPSARVSTAIPPSVTGCSPRPTSTSRTNYRAEVIAAGFEMIGLYGLEGPARMFPDFDERWADPRRREDMLRIAELVEAEPSLLGLSGHLLAVARKPQ